MSCPSVGADFLSRKGFAGLDLLLPFKIDTPDCRILIRFHAASPALSSELLTSGETDVSDAPFMLFGCVLA